MLNKTKKRKSIKVINYNHDFGELVLFSANKYQAVHRWYSLVEGFSSEFVRRVVGEQKTSPQVCLDPFGGVGTTALTCQDLGIKCFSFENNPFLFNLARTKLRTDYDPGVFQELTESLENSLSRAKKKPIIPELETDTLFEGKNKDKWIFDKSVTYGIFDILTWIATIDEPIKQYRGLFECALASLLVPISNVFRNGKCLSYKQDWKVTKVTREDVHRKVIDICRNIILIDLRTRYHNNPFVHNYIHTMQGDARNLISGLKDNSIDIVITSPPYLNSRDYADIYRLELWVLGYLSTFEQERAIRKSAIRSHVQIIWEDCAYPHVKELDIFIKHLANLNGQLWNQYIPKMVKGYFADMQGILRGLKPKLASGAMLYINVANSAYGNKVCEVDVILAEIARQEGYLPHEIREVRHVKSSRQQREVNKLRESIIVLEKSN